MANKISATRLYQEIHQQPESIAHFLQRSTTAIKELAGAIRKQNISHVIIAARGTSDNAGRYAKYVLGANNGYTIALTAPSLFSVYGKPPKIGNALVMGISQSGKSPDIISVLSEARRQGKLTAAITNEPESDLANEADFVIDLGVGEELAVAATKTYTAELAAIALLSTTLSQDERRLSELLAMPAAMADTLRMDALLSGIAPRYRYMSHCVVVGRGYNYATAFEIALKLKELTYTVVEPYSSADFMHGPLAMIGQGFPVIALAPSGVILTEMQEFVRQLGERGAEVIGISDDDTALMHSRIPLRLPVTVPEWLSPMTVIIPGQLLAIHLAYNRDYEIDNPRNIHKITKTL